MVERNVGLIGIVTLVLVAMGCSSPPVDEVAEDSPVLSGPYLGQEPPGLEGELFAPGVMSTEMDELNAVFLREARKSSGLCTFIR